jgi:flavin reductase (DIM6/NTAB) family NADH-FMN oxidoreductase RutF
VQHQQINEAIEDLYVSLSKGNVILTTKEAAGRANGMTVAWGFFGNLWNESFFIATVRPYRYTWKGIRESQRFTVNVLSDEYSEGLKYFGTVSGRTEDKFEKGYLHLDDTLEEYCAPILEAHLILDCTVVTTNNLQPCLISEETIRQFYQSDNGYHTLFYGRIDRMIRR